MKTLIKLFFFLVFVLSGMWIVMVWKQREGVGPKPSKLKEQGNTDKKSKEQVVIAKVNQGQVATGAATTERQGTILEIMRRTGPVDSKLLVKELGGINERTLRRDLVRLQELGLVTKAGSTKSATYSAVA